MVMKTYSFESLHPLKSHHIQGKVSWTSEGYLPGSDFGFVKQNISTLKSQLFGD
jgi:hypothetical protein